MLALWICNTSMEIDNGDSDTPEPSSSKRWKDGLASSGRSNVSEPIALVPESPMIDMTSPETDTCPEPLQSHPWIDIPESDNDQFMPPTPSGMSAEISQVSPCSGTDLMWLGSITDLEEINSNCT